MKVQSISTTNQNFKALTITPEAMQILKQEKGAATKINQYMKDLANTTKLDMKVSKLNYGDNIWMEFSGHRICWLEPFRQHDNMIGFYSGDARGDNEDDIVDFLKFSSKERAKEIYEDIKASQKNNTPMQKLTAAVKSVKAYEEGTLITPGEFWIKAKPLVLDSLKSENRINKTKAHEINYSDKIAKSTYSQTETKETKPSFAKRLKSAWQVLTGQKSV